MTLDISKSFDMFDMLNFFTNLHLTEIMVRFLVSSHYFSVIDSSVQFNTECPPQDALLIFEFLKAPFLVLPFFSYILRIFLQGLKKGFYIGRSFFAVFR